MGCSRKKKWKKPKKGRYVCTACGQVRTDKRKLCEPTKLKR
jgi:transcription initiation factor TFIIIB Brf1 subunit/transcription initiation factor TFIIB